MTTPNADYGRPMTQAQFDRLPQERKDAYHRAADAAQPVHRIIDEIASYERAFERAGGAPPYDSVSMAEIYGPRVQQLRDLQQAGYEYARWAWNALAGENDWHGSGAAS